MSTRELSRVERVELLARRAEQAASPREVHAVIAEMARELYRMAVVLEVRT